MEIPGYKIKRVIGEGGMATVYLAEQESLDRHVALKLLKKFDTPEQTDRFLNEGRIIASLNHRNIITIHYIGVIGEQHYLSMEYLEGGDLESRIKQGIEPQESLNLLREIGECLDFVHNKGIVHRDIKPANILFHKDGTPILTDFGIAKQLEQDIKLTADGTTMGSPYYLSPEQAECKQLDGRTDIYGLGIIFSEMLTGQKPYQGESYIEILVSHLSDPLPTLSSHLQKYQELINRLIAKEPNDRFESAAEMVDYIQKIQTTNPIKRVTRKVSGLVNGLHNSVAEDDIATKTMQLDQTILIPQTKSYLNKLQEKLIDTLHRKTGLWLLKNIHWQIITSTTLLIFLATSIWILTISEDTESIVEEYLVKAETAFETGNIASPEGDNAYYYYQEALKLAPNNELATVGVTRIVTYYADQAETELHQLNYENANYYVDEGLSIQPENPRLVALKERANVKEVLKKKAKNIGAYTKNAFNKLKSVFQ